MAGPLNGGLGVLALSAALIAPPMALAQTTTSTNCYMIGTTEHCDSRSSAPPAGVHIDWGSSKRPPDYAADYDNGYAEGRALAAEREASRQAELLAAEREADAEAASQRDEQAAELAAARAEIHRLQVQQRWDRAGRIGDLAREHKCTAVWAAAAEDSSDDIARSLANEFCPIKAP